MDAGPAHIELRGVVYREGPWWIAHCLEMDVVAEGDTPFEAISSAAELCGLKIEDAMREGDMRSIYRPAPPELWELYDRGKRFRKPPGKTLVLPNRIAKFNASILQPA